jgi:hypothetical protein
MSITRTASGIIIRETFASTTGWTAGTGYAVDSSAPTLITFDRSPIETLAPTAGGSDAGGVREFSPFVEGGTWYLYYGAGDGTAGSGGPWRPHIASSTDRGLTWTKHGPVNFGIQKTSNPADGNWAARDSLIAVKAGSTYYLYSLSAGSVMGSPAVVPGVPYGSDVFSSSSPLGPWTFVSRAIVPGEIGDGSDSTAGYYSTHTFDGSVYQVFSGTAGVAHAGLARFTAPALTGPWTVAEAPLSLPFTEEQENPKVFHHAGLSRYFMLVNGLTGNFPDRNVLYVSTSLTDWSAAKRYAIQRVCPMDAVNGVVGLSTPFFQGDGSSVVVDTDGSVPVVYDSSNTDGNYSGRHGFYAVLEPAANALHYTPTAPTTGYSTTFTGANGTTIPGSDGWTQPVGAVAPTIQSNQCDFGSATATENVIVNSGFSSAAAVVAADITAGSGCSVGIVLRYQDANNYYLVDFPSGSGLHVYKRVGGTLTSIYSSGVTLAGGTKTACVARITGSTIYAYVGGVMAAVVTDTAIASAGLTGLRCGAAAGVKLADGFRADAPAAPTTYARAVAHTDFVAEFAVEFPTPTDPTGFLAFDYRQDGAGHGYRVLVGPLQALWLLRDGGVIGTSSGSLNVADGYVHRLRVAVSGSSHNIYLDGELQVSVTDATYASGSTLGFAATTQESLVRLFHLRTGNTVTINGTSPGQAIRLRGAGGVPLATATAPAGNRTTLTLAHYPASSLEINGTDYADGAIFGGDTLVSPAATTATTYLLSGPSYFTVGVAGTVTVSAPAGRVFDGSTSITVASSPDGSPSSTTVTPAAGAVSASFSYTASTTGDKTFAATNTGGLTNPSNLVVASVQPPYRGAVLADSPVAYWRMDDAAGPTVTDTMGTQNGTANGCTFAQPGLVAAEVDAAITVNGSSDYATVPHNAAWNTANGSVGVVFKTSRTGQIQILVARDSGTGARNWQLRIDASNHLNFIGIFGSIPSLASTATVTDGQPHYALATWSYNSGANTTSFVLYLDGAQVATGSATGQMPSVTQQIDVGRFSSAGGSLYFLGTLDEVAFYNAALSSGRALAQYQAGTTVAAGYSVSPASTTGTAGAASPPFTITATSGPFNGGQSVTLTSSDATDAIASSTGASGTGALTVTPPAGMSTFTFTVTRLTGGTSTITPTNGQGWTNPAATSYTAVAGKLLMKRRRCFA